MPKYIDAEKLVEYKASGISELTKWQKGWNDAIDTIMNETPMVDAEPVVRCKDCKYNYHNMIPSGEAEHGCTKCIELPITADYYCAWGERKDDGRFDK